MRFMLLQNYAGGENCDVPMTHWAPEEIQAHIDYQRAVNGELTVVARTRIISLVETTTSLSLR